MAEELKGCQFLLETGASHYLYDLLDARGLDVIVAAELGAEDAWVEVHPLVARGLCRGRAQRRGDPAGDVLRQLKRMTMVQYTQRHYMGRLVNAHLAKQNLTLRHRFEIDSYHAILALVGRGLGGPFCRPWR